MEFTALFFQQQLRKAEQEREAAKEVPKKQLPDEEMETAGRPEEVAEEHKQVIQVDELKVEAEDERFEPQIENRTFTCVMCGEYNDEMSLFTMTYIFKKCMHEVCSECYTFENILDYPNMCCPVEGCGIRLMESEIEDYYGKKEYLKVYRIHILKEFEDMNLFECTCGNMFQIEEEERVNYNHRKPNGEEMKKEHCEHLSKHRVYCPDCKTDCCKTCNEKPYHYSFTCEQYEEEVKYDRCRFCNQHIEKGRKICNEQECRQKNNQYCQTKLGCGHFCFGMNGDAMHPPCLDPICVANDKDNKTLGEDKDAFCNICWCEALGDKPIIYLDCKHIFHKECLHKLYNEKWGDGFINFKFAHCPSCNQFMEAKNDWHIKGHQPNYKNLQNKVKDKAVKRAEIEGLDKEPRLKDQKSEYFNDLAKLAVDKLAYYQCHKCNDPYFGGLKECGAGLQQQQEEEKKQKEEEEKKGEAPEPEAAE